MCECVGVWVGGWEQWWREEGREGRGGAGVCVWCVWCVWCVVCMVCVVCVWCVWCVLGKGEGREGRGNRRRGRRLLLQRLLLFLLTTCAFSIQVFCSGFSRSFSEGKHKSLPSCWPALLITITTLLATFPFCLKICQRACRRASEEPGTTSGRSLQGPSRKLHFGSLLFFSNMWGLVISYHPITGQVSNKEEARERTSVNQTLVCCGIEQ